ncbi:MAG: hypothetical protein ACTTJS_02355 [Wolinella sp.]
MTLLAILEYDGSAFFGSQIQNGVPSVAGEFERILRSVGVFSAARFSGRTDRGVHATRQAVCFEISYNSDWETLRQHLNKKLAPHMRLRRLYPVRDGLDPRREAKNRAYRYIFSTAPLDPFQARFVSYERAGSLYEIRTFLDSSAVRDGNCTNFNGLIDVACETDSFGEKSSHAGEDSHFCDGVLDLAFRALIGRHDFVLFHKNGSEPSSTIREIHTLRLYKYRGFWVFYIEANGFLRLQVRLLIGALLALSRGDICLEQFLAQLEGRERTWHIPASPNGLYLCNIGFASEIWEV